MRDSRASPASPRVPVYMEPGESIREFSLHVFKVMFNEVTHSSAASQRDLQAEAACVAGAEGSAVSRPDIAIIGTPTRP